MVHNFCPYPYHTVPGGMVLCSANEIQKPFCLLSHCRAIRVSGDHSRYCIRYFLIQECPDLFVFQFAGHVKCKRIEQYTLRFFFTETAGAEVEQGILIQLSDRGTVAAFHIIRKNLKLWLGVDRCIITHHNIIVLLESIRFLSDGMYIYFSIEDGSGTVGHDSLVKLVAFTIRLLMIYQGMIVHQLITACEV